MIEPVYRGDKILIVKCEDLFYPEYKGKFFVIQKSDGYGYFHDISESFTKGEILDKFGVVIQK